MTKEPKLQAAVRIVPEWQDYDQEIKQLHSRFQKEKESGTLTTTDGMKQQNRKGKLYSLPFRKMALLKLKVCCPHSAYT